MKTYATNPVNEAQPAQRKGRILNSSIREMLVPKRPALSSAIHRAGRIGLLSIACAASAVTAHAQYIWDGGGSSSNWSDPNNWSGYSSPSSGAQIHFAGNVDLTPFNDLTLVGSNAANSITFDANSGQFTLSGGTIGLTNGITNNSSVTQTISMQVQLAGAQTWTPASADIIVNSTVNLSGCALTVAGPGAITFNGAITDSSSGGSLTQIGGIIFLNGVNTYTGSTTVNGGVLYLNGSVASAQTTINSGGALEGNGTIGGNLTNNGIVAPVDANYYGLSGNLLLSLLSSAGNSISGVPLGSTNLALTVKGNYTQTQNGALVIFYAGQGSNEHTTLNVQGKASLNGTLRLVQVDGGKLTAGEQVPIVTAAGGVNGKFSVVENASLLNASVVYEPTSVVLEVQSPPQGNLFNTLKGVSGISGNLLAVARGLDSAANDPRAARIFAILNSDNLSQLVKDVEHIDPDKLTSMSSAGTASSGVHLQNIQLRMEALQSGATGFSALGFHVTDDSTDSSPATSAYAGPTGPDGKGGKEVSPPPVNDRWGTFITGAGEFDRVGDTQAARGFNLDSGGITLGIDYRFTDHFVAGIFSGYTYTGINIADGGRIAVDAGKVGLYATYFDGGFYVNSAVQGGYDTYETNRASLGGIAHSSPVGGDLNVLFAPGYNWTMGGFTFGPTSRFQYAYESTNGFTETGSLAPLTVASQHTESIISAFGVKASYDWKIGTAILRPELRLEWEHEYGDVATSVGSALASGAGNSFTVTGPQIGRDDMHIGAGFALVLSERLSTYLYYDGEVFRTNYDASTVTGGFRFLF
jgi:autotransporter-associated beta strand protein